MLFIVNITKVAAGKLKNSFISKNETETMYSFWTLGDKGVSSEGKTDYF